MALSTSACLSGPRALSPQQLEALATRLHAGRFDEVYDATWLALEREGLTVTEGDRHAGTLAARRRDGSGYDVTIRADQRLQRVVLMPVPERERWLLDGEDGERARWDAVEISTAALLAAWRELPEWTVAAERNLVWVPGLRATLPQAWEKLEPSVSRRLLTAQRSRSMKRGFNPTFRLEVKRREPQEDHRPFLVDIAGVALFATRRLAWPSELRLAFAGHEARGRVGLLDEGTARPVLYALWVGHSEAFTVRVGAVCGPQGDPETGCADAWRDLVETLSVKGYGPPRDVTVERAAEERRRSP